MAVVKMRELLRSPKLVFEQLERSGEPVLLTRDGQAVAALFPVDPEEAEQIAMAALPEFVASRARASDARSEGRTGSAEELLADFAAHHEGGGGEPFAEPAEAPAREPEHAPGGEVGFETTLHEDLAVWFGEALSQELVDAAVQRVAAASEPVLSAAPPEVQEEDDARLEFVRRVRQLNGELFGRLLPEALERTTRERLALVHEQGHAAPGGEGVFGKPLAMETLDAVTARVKSFNSDLVANELDGHVLSLKTYEVCMRGAQALGADARQHHAEVAY